MEHKEYGMTLLMAEQDPVTTKYRASDKLLEAGGQNVAYSSFLPGEGQVRWLTYQINHLSSLGSEQ